MKKTIVFLLTGIMLLSLAACGKTENEHTNANIPSPTETIQEAETPDVLPEETPVTETEPTEAPTGKTISPLPVTVDVNNLLDCTVAVSIDTADLSADNAANKVLPVTVYTYDLYDMIDIAMLEVGDTIILREEEVAITELVRTDAGSVQINGGLDMGGYELITNEDTVYFETGYSDVKTYFAVGTAVLPVSDDFVFTDSADPENNEATYAFDDLFTDKVAHIFGYTPHNTRIIIQEGVVTHMERIYTP